MFLIFISSFFTMKSMVLYVNKFCIYSNTGIGEIESTHAHGAQTSGSEKADMC